MSFFVSWFSMPRKLRFWHTLTISKTCKHQERMNMTTKNFQDETNLTEIVDDFVDGTENLSNSAKQSDNFQKVMHHL